MARGRALLIGLLRCEACGEEETFPFKCAYCGKYFCGEHRLPENHACTGYAFARPPRQYTTTNEGRISYFPGFGAQPSSGKEITSFTIATALVWLVGISLLGFALDLGSLVNSVLFVVAFLGHEYAHKIAAHRHGLWAEFRLNSFGALLTALSVILPIKFVAPGAVMLGGYSDERTLGVTAACGPLVNVAMSAILFPFVYLVAGWGFLWPAFYVSSFIAVFNLIPIAILDGKKIFDWNKTTWAIMFAVSIIFLAIAWMTSGYL
jgi:Zn-dependent protease